MYMQIVVLLVVAVVVPNLDAFRMSDPKFKTVADACAKETGFDLTTLPTDMADRNAMKQALADPKGQCFMACTAKKMGMITENDEINVEKASQVLKNTEKASIEKYAKQCADEVTDTEPCAKVAKLQHCFFRNLYGKEN